MTKRGTQNGRRGYLAWGIGIGVFFGFIVAFGVQALAPSLAKVPGLLICGGDDFVLYLRRRTSFGVCGGDATRQISYITVLGVSTLVWSVICAPLGIVVARWMAGKASRR